MHKSLRSRRAVTVCLALLLGPLLLAQPSAVQPELATFHVFGLVASPGPYAWPESLTVKDAVALADGYTADGSKTALESQRMVDGKLVTSDATEDDVVESDDVVMVRGEPFRPSARGPSSTPDRCAASVS